MKARIKSQTKPQKKRSPVRRIQKLIFTGPLLFFLCFCLLPLSAAAASTDQIRDFTITVDVNDDASLNMAYHLDWEVLDDSIGKLEWIDLGVPNSHHENITPQSSTIDHIEDKGSSLAIYLDRAYAEGETVSVDFSMKQDYMYQIDKWNEGETAYSFTPAWFDGMEVDHLTIRWNMEGAVSWQPDCLQDGGYLTFDTSLSSGEKYTISVSYPNDTFGFAPERQAGTSSNGGSSGFSDVIIGLIAVVLVIGGITLPILAIVWFSRWIARGLGFGPEPAVRTKIKRTKIEYYENCPSCGAAREEGKDSCPYCKRSMIKSKEVVEENQLEEPEKYTKKGTYRYGSSPNTYIRVNVVNVPSPRPHRSSHSSGSGGSSHHSCACACASSCACACACASSGRAGCTVKDFFKRSIHEGRVRVRCE